MFVENTAPTTSDTVSPVGSAAPERLAVINGLRGIAILMVMYHHLFGDTWSFETPQLHSWARVLVPIGAGWLGVNIFFVLSGFVLFLPYAKGARRLHGREDWRAFYARRARRLMPLYYLNVLIAIVLVNPPGREFVVRDWLVMASVTFNFHPATFMPPCNWVLWSLGLEIWFSVVFPSIVLLALRVGIGRLFAAICVVSLTVRYIGVATYPSDPHPLDWISSSLPGRLDDFAVGIVLAHLFCRGIQPPRWLRFVGPWLGVAFLYAAAVLAAATGGYVSRWWLPLVNTLAQLATFCMLWSSLFHGTPVRRAIFANAPLQIVGMMCFSLYVWHGLVMITCGAHGAFGLPLLRFLVSLSLLSLCCYVFIEFGAEKDWRKLFRVS